MLRTYTLHQVLSLLLTLVVVPLLFGALALTVTQSRTEQDVVKNQMMTLAQTLAQAVDRELDHAKGQLEVIAQTRVMQEEDWKGLYALCVQITAQKPGRAIFLTGPHGEQIFNTAAAWGVALPNTWLVGDGQEFVWNGRSLPLSSSQLTQDVFRQGRPVYSDLYYGISPQEPRLALAIPVFKNGRVAFALTMSFSPDLIERLINSAVDAPELRATVVDRQWRTVATNGRAASRVGEKTLPFKRQGTAFNGTFEVIARDGVEVHGGYAVSSVNGFWTRVARPAGTILSNVRNFSAEWFSLLAGAILLSGLMVGVMVRRIAVPLRRLSQAAQDGQAPDDPPTGIVEIDVLSQALRTGHANAIKHREALVVSAQRKQREKELRTADRQKDVFLATLAHELRNPLAPIRSAAELIAKRQVQDPIIVQAHLVIERQARHLSLLVDDLLEVSRISLGTIKLKHEKVELNALALLAVELVKPAAQVAGLTLTLQTETEPVWVWGDPNRLSQCLSNLLNNATKFTPPGGSVVLMVRKDLPQARPSERLGSTVSLVVEDSGIGLTHDELEPIFGLFAQTHHSGTLGHTGLGIGLALTRKLVALHGGQIYALSEGAGRGSQFRIDLPACSPAMAAKKPWCPTPQDQPDPLPGPVVALETAAVTAPVLPKQSLAEAAQSLPSLLVVDDNQDAAHMLGEVMALSGYEVSYAYAGETALRVFRDTMPAALLLDIGLPDIDGYEVCRRIRRLDGPPQPVIIAVTGWGQDKDREASNAAGFDGHMTKPTDPDELLALLAQRLKARQKEVTGSS